jgi:mannan endo-1,4-beta-mannosidase
MTNSSKPEIPAAPGRRSPKTARKTARLLAGIIGACVFLAAVPAPAAETPLTDFISARAGRLFDGEKEFRFISFNIPNLLLVEDNVGFAQENPWRLPDKFEINDALATVAAMGGTVARTYVISVQRTNDAPGTPRHVLAPGKFNETAFRTLDEVLAAANRTGVRLIIPLVDNWPWMGGRAEYAGFRGKTKDDFWTDPQIIADFEQTIHFILTRTNTITGVRYGDDPAVFCWETGNEIPSPASWTREITRYIKSLDTNHLVMDGFNSSQLRDESLALPDVDIVTTHHYPGQKKSFAELINANAEQARGKKPYIVGEFGFVSTAQMAGAMQAIVDSGASGGLLWSLRFRNRDGGFYWHSEPFGGNLYKAFHWPGSRLGEPYDEAKLLDLVRANAFAIRGIRVPAAAVPPPPKLLPIADAAAISWQGSVGATGYQVERATKRDGGWQIVATNVDEAFTQYRPQFADETVPAGRWFYRVRARNDAGLSEPSNLVGPVKVTNATLVDELADFSKVSAQRGDWEISNRDCRSAREDAHRAAGLAGDFLIYQLPDAVQSFRVSAFFPKAESDAVFSVSSDGRNFQAVAAQKEVYFHGAGEYGYWKPVLFHAEKIRGGNFLKIELTGETQLGRVEISHPAPAP